jgi:hypothetical protein
MFTQVKKQLAQHTEIVSEMGKKIARLANGFVYSPILNSTHIWRVVIHTPV